MDKTCDFLIKFIHENDPSITGIYKMRKPQLAEIYVNILKSKQEKQGPIILN